MTVVARHWKQICHEVQRSFDHTSPEFTLERIVALGLEQHADKISEISGAASKELSIEQVRFRPFSFTLSLSPFSHFLSLSLSPSLPLSPPLYLPPLSRTYCTGCTAKRSLFNRTLIMDSQSLHLSTHASRGLRVQSSEPFALVIRVKGLNVISHS